MKFEFLTFNEKLCHVECLSLQIYRVTKQLLNLYLETYHLLT